MRGLPPRIQEHCFEKILKTQNQCLDARLKSLCLGRP